MCDIQEADAAESRYEEYDIEPAMVEVELKISQHLRDDGSTKRSFKGSN